MKKTLTAILFATMVLALTACGKQEATPSATPTATPTTAPEATKTPETTDAPEVTKAPENNNENNTADTIGNKVLAIFKAEIANTTDVVKLAETLADKTADVLDMGMGSMEVVPGFLNGFDGDVNGFTKGAQFSPFIGSIPFVGFVFESTDAEALKAELLSKANPRWNICTEADETICEVSGNYVFFLMCPSSNEV